MSDINLEFKVFSVGLIVLSVTFGEPSGPVCTIEKASLLGESRALRIPIGRRLESLDHRLLPYKGTRVPAMHISSWPLEKILTSHINSRVPGGALSKYASH